MLLQTCDIMNSFESQVLKKMWTHYHISVWTMNKEFNSFTGQEVKSFIQNIAEVLSFFSKTFEMTEYLDNLCESLVLWKNDILPFIHITTIDDNNGAYLDSIYHFESSLKRFYACGANTFLTKTETGDIETFYMHVLRFYLPPLAHATFSEHNLGLGVFTMQGYERRNKESKNTWKRFNNNKGNFVVPNIRRLWDIFKHGKNAC